MNNAIRRTPPGGKIDLSVRKTQGRTELLISETCTVIPEDERARVSDSFFCSPGNEEMGSVLGLSFIPTMVLRVGATFIWNMSTLWKSWPACRGFASSRSLRVT